MIGRRVALVGAGPGDPDLLTLRAEAVLAAASAVVCDSAVQRLARRFASRARVVVVPDGLPAVPVLLAAVSHSDGDVVRLYAGDPWLHAAHGVESTALHRAGITTEAIAGVAIEVAVPARAGIAVHVRHLAMVCTLVTVEAVPPSVDAAHTLVVACDDGAAEAKRLVAAGGSDIPAAILPLDGEAEEARGTLGDLAGGDARGGRSLVVVGAVVGAESRESPAAGAEPFQAVRVPGWAGTGGAANASAGSGPTRGGDR